MEDALSRKHDTSPDALHHYISSTFPSQVPITFCIDPLLPEISSWMISWLRKIKEPTELEKAPKIKNTEFGKDGANTARPSQMNMTHSSKTYQKSLEQDCSEHLPPPYADASFLDRTRDLWLQAQWKRPWQNWVRSLGQTWGSTPPMVTRMEGSIPALPDNSKE